MVPGGLLSGRDPGVTLVALPKSGRLSLIFFLFTWP
jgi:hypothetical protein